MTMEVCVWHGVGYDSTFVEEPSIDQLTEAVRSLNGGDRNDLYVRSSSGEWMGLGGGPDQVMVTFADGEEGPFYEAVTGAEPSGDMVRIVVGGQGIDLSPHMLLSPDQAIRAVTEFVASGHRPTNLTWTPQPH